MIGVYKIVNCTTGKFYIGSAVNINRRWSQHKSQLKRNKHSNPYLQYAWNKYGEARFSLVILEVVNRNELMIKEQGWLDWLKPYDREVGYNFHKLSSSPLGVKHSEQSRLNMSLAHRGKRHSEEQKLKIKIGNTGKKKPMSEEKKLEVAERNMLSMRKPDKWPCFQGIRCKCVDCVRKKSAYSLAYYHKTKNNKVKSAC